MRDFADAEESPKEDVPVTTDEETSATSLPEGSCLAAVFARMDETVSLSIEEGLFSG